MAIFNIENYIQIVIQNSIPQPHRSKWTDEEDNIIIDCIKYGLSLSDIHKIISLRTPEAIRTRANHLGYGFYRNRDDGLTYFHNKINHNYRRTKNEIQAWKESVPIPIEPHDSLGKDNKVDVDIIPKIATRVEISVVDLSLDRAKLFMQP